MKKLLIILALAAVSALLALGFSVGAAQAAPVRPVAVIHPANAADGCSVFHAGDTLVQCTGGYTGRIGYFRAVQTCHWLFGTQTQTGPWVMIGKGRWSGTDPCGGFWSDHPHYELRGP